MHRLLVPFLLAVLGAGGVSRGIAAADLPVTFEGQIRPILKAHCFPCHGEGEKLKGGVDLRLRHFMAETKTDDGQVMVPGRPELSLMLKLVKAGEMPKGGKKLARPHAWRYRDYVIRARGSPIIVTHMA